MNALIRTLPIADLVENPLPQPKSWLRVDCGTTEVYVADRLFVVALLERQHKDVTALTSAHLNTEETIIKYLRGEGFIDDEYAYVGLQKFELGNLNLEGLDDDENLEELGGLE